MALPPFFTDAIAKAADGITKSMMNGLDKLFTSKDEKMKNQVELDKIQAELQKETVKHLEEMAKLQFEETKAYLADTADARNSNVKIQESDKASWLSKNLAYILDAFIFLIWGSMTVYLIAMMLNFVKADKGADVSGVLGVYSGVTAIAMTVLNFHRGTSRGSEVKQKFMEKNLGAK